ncbi:hypothetical protein TK50_07230 [Micromonospora haikouensis]|uniref:Uncharacterized protein n=1 Tax=Micromonospora haikouensis TaxID=686309 RepID=A0A0D0X296_9ACTN|nr:hypothetical protein TK50_07230 [Micromonospora haikouensis]
MSAAAQSAATRASDAEASSRVSSVRGEPDVPRATPATEEISAPPPMAVAADRPVAVPARLGWSDITPRFTTGVVRPFPIPTKTQTAKTATGWRSRSVAKRRPADRPTKVSTRAATRMWLLKKRAARVPVR